ncbi:GNAT family N-acetyltransferase [Providencia burhodogranariea]|uniref:N-acetyltransferase GCN5 n=1 Tax=Providencia burhodogranariea DSM 19968 TaxID=1141662 RepID=K8WT69_9GAMM|nr:GNAT family N-acetyltransferase [Providencia burhodogranariea]EKT63834.1 N-acetyltransferase GCN5 [Providencia burhodogranariea DSM 19968]
MFLIRQAKKSDAKNLSAIEYSAAQIFRGHVKLGWIADGNVQSEQEHLSYIQQQLEWVAVDNNNQPIGFINIQKLKNSLHIREVSVDQSWQGKGVGRELIQHVLGYALQKKVNNVTLTTFRDVPWNAPYYQRLGFSIIEASELSCTLKSILQQEVDTGFAIEDRCAMIYPSYLSSYFTL